MKNRKKLVSILAGIMAAVMLLSLIVSLIPTKASAASSSELKQQINELKEQYKQTQAKKQEVSEQYEENQNEIEDIVDRKAVIDNEILLIYEQIDNINEQLSAYALLIADKQDELDEAQSRMDELTAKNKERIRTMEEEGTISYWAVLFKANSFSDLLDRLSMIEEIAAADRQRLKELDEAAEEVEAAQEALKAEKAELDEAMAEMDATEAELKAKQEEAQELLQELIAHSKELAELYDGFEMEEEQFLKDIAAAEQEYNEAKRQEYIQYMSTYVTVPPSTAETTGGSTTNGSGTTDGNSSGTTSGGSTGGTTSSGSWLVPCSYVKVSSPFGNREQPTAGASTYHQGIDLSAPEGTPIYASRTGIITVKSTSKSAGNYITINHGDGYSSVYMHMSRFASVSVGQAVSAGQVIGYVGSTGISTGNHLHFGIMYNGSYVNPANYVNFH